MEEMKPPAAQGRGSGWRWSQDLGGSSLVILVPKRARWGLKARSEQGLLFIYCPERTERIRGSGTGRTHLRHRRAEGPGQA